MKDNDSLLDLNTRKKVGNLCLGDVHIIVTFETICVVDDIIDEQLRYHIFDQSYYGMPQNNL